MSLRTKRQGLQSKVEFDVRVSCDGAGWSSQPEVLLCWVIHFWLLTLFRALACTHRLFWLLLMAFRGPDMGEININRINK